MAIASMVCGIISIPIFCFWYISMPLALIAIILGFVAKSQAATGRAGGAGMAVAGIVCGFVAMGLFVLLLAGAMATLGIVSNELQNIQNGFPR